MTLCQYLKFVTSVYISLKNHNYAFYTYIFLGLTLITEVVTEAPIENDLMSLSKWNDSLCNLVFVYLSILSIPKSAQPRQSCQSAT